MPIREGEEHTIVSITIILVIHCVRLVSSFTDFMYPQSRAEYNFELLDAVRKIYL